MKEQGSFRSLWVRILAVITVLSMLLPAVVFRVYAEEIDPASGETTIQIVHTNDIHGYYTATNRGVIGFAKLKTFADSVGADLILDAGDTYHGQAFATVEKGLGIAELMKAVGYDATTPGNHDWSYGAERLKDLEAVQGFPILAANVVDQEGNAYFDTPYLVKTVTADDGTQLKVGVVGVIDRSFYDSTASDNVKNVAFEDEVVAASETAKKLKEEEGCDIVIALTHCADCESFVSGLSDVDAVVAGHQHILIDTQYSDKHGKTVYVVEAGYYFYNIGVLSLTYDAETSEIAKAEETSYSAEDLADVEADPVVSDKIAEIEARENETLSQPIGTSSSEYPYSWEEIRVAEQPIGRIVTAAYLERTGADVAFENAGGIRGGIPQGDVTYKDLIGISPYGNTIVTKELSGSQILDLVEYSLELSRQCNEIYSLQKEAAAKGEDYTVYQWPDNSGSVLQFGGINVQYDMGKPSGSRIVSAQIGGKAVEPDKIYVVATNNYAAENTDYPELSAAPLAKEYGTCEQALLAYIQEGTFEQAAEKANLTEYQPEVTPKPDDTPNDDSGNNAGGNTGDNGNNSNSNQKNNTNDRNNNTEDSNIEESSGSNPENSGSSSLSSSTASKAGRKSGGNAGNSVSGKAGSTSTGNTGKETASISESNVGSNAGKDIENKAENETDAGENSQDANIAPADAAEQPEVSDAVAPTDAANESPVLLYVIILCGVAVVVVVLIVVKKQKVQHK